MPTSIPLHSIDGKKEEGLIWATDKENLVRAAKDPPLAALTPKQYWAQTEDNALKSYYRAKVQELADDAATAVKAANPEDP